MAKLILKADSPEQELKLHQGLVEHSARKILAAAGNPHFELQTEGNQRRQDKKAKKRTANIEKACRLYDQYRADDEKLQVKAIKLRIAQEVGVSIKSVERYLRESKK